MQNKQSAHRSVHAYNQMQIVIAYKNIIIVVIIFMRTEKHNNNIYRVTRQIIENIDIQFGHD